MGLTIVKYGFLALGIVLVIFVLLAVNKTQKKRGRGSKAVGIVAAILTVWIVGTGILSSQGVFSDFESMPPKFAFLLVPMLVSLVVIATNKKFGAFIREVPVTWLIFPQVFRVIVEFQLWYLHKENVLPYQLTFEGWNFDIAVGLTAPIIGYLVYVKGSMPLIVGAIWNALSFIVLMVVVVTAVLSLPTPFQVFTNEPSNVIVTEFPVVYLPVILVTFALGMHLFALRWHFENKKGLVK